MVCGYLLWIVVLLGCNLASTLGAPRKFKNMCEKLEISGCARLLNYTSMSLPNLYLHESQDEAEHKLQWYLPLIRKYGFESGLLLHKLWCAMLAPPCQRDWIPPCRDVCLVALRGFKRQHKRALTKGEMAGITESVDCRRLPTGNRVRTNTLDRPTLGCQLKFEGRTIL